MAAALTPVEERLTELIYRGKHNKEIAFIMHLAESTIKEYLNRLYKKAGVHSRTQLAIWEHERREAAKREQVER